MTVRKIIFFFSLILLLTSCAYFNTYYNANKLFKEAQKSGFDEQGRPRSNAIQKYNKVIKKCGVILTDYKGSKWADDALFLLARSFFYKGNSYTLAIEKFNDILNFYPDSKFVPDAHIYIARSNYRFNKKELAYQQLQDFINNAQFQEKHPQAMLVLANYYLENDDLIEANYYFQRIIDKYPDSEEYDEAFFLQGKTQYAAANYQQSNQVFTELLEARVNKKIKLDARYYIALNYLLMGDPENSYDYITDLKKDEYRLDNLPKIQLLEARCLSELGQIDAAIELFELIITEYKNSLLAAEASYFLAETYFTQLQDYNKAIEAYSDVKKQNRKSEYVELAVSRSSVIGEIIQYNNPDLNIPTRDLVTQKLKLAEYYIEVLNMPDSALSIYNKIIQDPVLIQSRLDSLKAIRQNIPDSVYQISEDLDITDEPALEDSLIEVEFSDTTAIDSTKIESTSNDTIPTISIPENDSLKAVTLTELDELIEKSATDLKEYRNEYIPFARFVKIWIYTTIKQDTLKATEAYNKMQKYSSENEYTPAAEALINGKKIELIDHKLKQDKLLYEEFQNLLITKPDSAYALLEKEPIKQDFTYYDKLNFTLGMHYYELGDTLSAKQYFDRILVQETTTEYNSEINKIYDGSNFITTDRLDYFTQKDTEADSLDVEIKLEPDSSDTSDVDLEITPRVDSLSIREPALILDRYDPPAPKTLDITEKKINLEIEVLADGTVGKVNVLGDLELQPELIKYIEATIKRWDFKPATENGVPVNSTIVDQLEFIFD